MIVCVCKSGRRGISLKRGRKEGKIVESYPLKADGSPSNLDKLCAINVSLNNMKVTSCQQAQITNLNISQAEDKNHYFLITI